MDVVDNVGRANGMLVSPTLFGLTHDELAEEERERKEASSSDGGMYATMRTISSLICQSLPRQLHMVKVTPESAKSLSSMRTIPSELRRHLDRLSPGCHRMHG